MMTTGIADKVSFSAPRQALADALSVIGRVAGARAAIPVLAGVRLQVVGDALTLAGTDLDLTAVVETPVSGYGDGVVVVPAKLLAEVVKVLNPGDVRLQVEDDELRVTSGRSSFVLRSLPEQDFPSIPPEPTSKAVTLEAAGFSEALRQVLVAASEDDNRAILTGVLMEAGSGGLRLVATDSYRMAIRDLSGSTDLVGEGEPLLVPARSLNELLRVLGTTGDLTVYPGENDITFLVGNVRLTSRLIAGEYPSYRNVIPPTPPNVLRAPKVQFAEAVRRVKLMARDDTTPVRLSLTDGGLFGMKVVAAEVGEASEEVEATYDGVEQTVAFNPAFLLDGIEAAPGDEIELRMQDRVKPALLGAVGAPEFVYLLVPIRV